MIKVSSTYGAVWAFAQFKTTWTVIFSDYLVYNSSLTHSHTHPVRIRKSQTDCKATELGHASLVRLVPESIIPIIGWYLYLI